jgi:cytosine/adenosine deaminase-related metal-dependent hydrolase
MASSPFRCEPADTPSFEDFRGAISQLTACACCCGALTAPAIVALDVAREGAKANSFSRLGAKAWRAKVRPRKPRLPQETGRYILPDVTVIDAERPPAAHVDVEVGAGRVVAVRPAGVKSQGRPAPVLEDCRGAFVSSALVDMHVHMPLANVLKLTDLFLLQTLRYGITAVRDAGDADGTSTPAALGAVLSGALPGPEIRYVYSFVTQSPARWVNSFDFREPSEAPAIVERLKRLGATWVKSYENLDRLRIDALIAAAASAALGVMGHTPYELAYEEALLPDAQHYMGVPPPASLRRNAVWNRAIDWDAVDQPRIDVVRRACVERGLAMTPTLQLTHSFLKFERYEEARRSAEAKALPKFFADIVWHPQIGIPAYRNPPAEDFDRCRRAIEKKNRLTAALHADGATLRLGTDTQQPFTAPGISLHSEIAAFVEAGVPHAAIFKFITLDAMRALNIVDAGRVAEGARAELMVCRRSPLEQGWDVRADLIATVAKGALVYARDLDREIRRELGRFEGLFADYASRWAAKFALNKLARNFVA